MPSAAAWVRVVLDTPGIVRAAAATLRGVTAWTEVGDRVFVTRYAFYNQNIGVVLGDESVLLVDTRLSHRQAEEVKADLRALTRLPVGVVVNTHGHSDHCFGNHPFRPATIWGHERCVTMIETTGERQRQGTIAAIPELASELYEVVFDPPDRTFSDAATVEIEPGGRSVELRYLGRGHTDNDIVVLVPDADVMFAGDLVEADATPFFGDGFPIDWPDDRGAARGARDRRGRARPRHRRRPGVRGPPDGRVPRDRRARQARRRGRDRDRRGRRSGRPTPPTPRWSRSHGRWPSFAASSTSRGS